MNNPNITLLVPTRKRHLLLQRMWDSALETAKYPELLELSVYVDDDDIATQEHLKTMKGNIKITIGKRITLSDMPNETYKKATSDILTGGGDDVIYRTKNWDEIVMNVFNRYKDKLVLVYPNDLIFGNKLATIFFLHRRWIETLGYYLPPYYSCDMGDVWMDEVSKLLGRRIYLSDVIVEHMHYRNGKAPFDEIYAEGEARGKKDDVWKLYYSHLDKRLDDIEKLRNAMKIKDWKLTNEMQ